MKKSLNTAYLIAVICMSMLLSISCSSSRDYNGEVLLPEVVPGDNVSATTNLSDVFTKYKIIPLETNENSLIGGWSNKIIKRGGHFFVSSFNDVIIFDQEGKYVSKLSHAGAGPEEYEQLYDYDVVDKYGEIWVSSHKGIYRYNLATLEYAGLIPLTFYTNKFKYINDETIIVCTSEQEVFKIIDISGDVVKSYYEADKANSTLKAIQFMKYGNLVVSQLENSNDIVVYDINTKKFDIRNIISPNPSLETAEINRDYLNKYGYLDQPKKVMEDFTGISSFRTVGDVTILIAREPGKKWTLNITDNGKNKGYVYAPEEDCKLINNLTPSTHPLIYNTLTSGESDDSFIFTFIAEDDTESNPSILEVTEVSL